MIGIVIIAIVVAATIVDYVLLSLWWSHRRLHGAWGLGAFVLSMWFFIGLPMMAMLFARHFLTDEHRRLCGKRGTS